MLCETLGIQNVNKLRDNEISAVMWKKTVNDAVWINNEKCIKEDIANNYKKLQNIKNDNFGRKDYLSSKSIENCRMNMRVRSHMVKVKQNFKNLHKNKPNGLFCEYCKKTEVESQIHVLSCTAYKKLREGLDLSKHEDMINYYREVMAYRDKLSKK